MKPQGIRTKWPNVNGHKSRFVAATDPALRQLSPPLFACQEPANLYFATAGEDTRSKDVRAGVGVLVCVQEAAVGAVVDHHIALRSSARTSPESKVLPVA